MQSFSLLNVFNFLSGTPSITLNKTKQTSILNHLCVSSVQASVTQSIISKENILSKFQCGFRKGTSAQHCLIVMLEKWKKAVDMKGCAGALLTDLSKAFDCISH